MTVINGKFEWDSEKDEINKIKHGFSFSEILDVFDDPFFIERYDIEHSSLEEERYIGLGESGGAVIVMTAYTERERTRLISARFATESERKLYYDSRKNS
ncbi:MULTISPECIES: BrnT family toxin [unclassified Treponema]|uniref:BrnT family toxin n=1 Tax=unclassified Treponema TaxID=2638727 RepID=UPI0025DEF3F0|nr:MULTISPECIES: BrnT family toxin [unclassified Treponema]MBQ8679488.1 BrnT family toxin [Treponema sp.]